MVRDSWPDLFSRVLKADILVLCGPVWLGDSSSGDDAGDRAALRGSGLLNGRGQYIYHGRDDQRSEGDAGCRPHRPEPEHR